MISFKNTDLFESSAQAYVNAVNTAGAMGKGIALRFKETYPDNFLEYKTACKDGICRIGKVFVTQRMNHYGPRYIINFPTKRSWRDNSDMNYIEWGLLDLRKALVQYEISSVAIPALGCGNGGLEWSKVKPLMESHLKDLTIDIEIYEPIG
jgi:O-acetyl-ADP-ribose deacetylase (regulator of RNase III)